MSHVTNVSVNIQVKDLHAPCTKTTGCNFLGFERKRDPGGDGQTGADSTGFP